MNIGTQIDKASALRDEYRALDQQLKELKDKRDALELQIIDSLREQGLDASSGKKATASISEEQLPKVVDWTKFERYIYRHKGLHLIQRRPAVAAYREELETRNGRLLPGVETFEKTKLNLRVRN